MLIEVNPSKSICSRVRLPWNQEYSTCGATLASQMQVIIALRGRRFEAAKYDDRYHVDARKLRSQWLRDNGFGPIYQALGGETVIIPLDCARDI